MRMTRRVVKQNIALSLGLKLVVLGLAVPGLASLWLAVLADENSRLKLTRTLHGYERDLKAALIDRRYTQICTTAANAALDAREKNL